MVTISTPGGSVGCELRELRTHALDDGERVLALAHDDDAAHGVALAVEIGHAAPDVGTHRDLRQLPDQDGRAGLGLVLDHDALDVVR